MQIIFLQERVRCLNLSQHHPIQNQKLIKHPHHIKGKNNGYFIIDKSGNIIEENNHIHLAGFGSPDAILGRKYVLFDWDDGRTSYDGMSIFDLDKGRTDINLHSYINHKYKKPSKLNYTNISTSGNKMVISLKIIFYDNTTTDEKIIVDIDLGEIIE